jgi:hypothetical protein
MLKCIKLKWIQMIYRGERRERGAEEMSGPYFLGNFSASSALSAVIKPLHTIEADPT